MRSKRLNFKEYLIKDEAKSFINERYKRTYFMETLGYGRCTVSNILNGYRSCPKYTAYAFTKAIDKNANVEDYFMEV